MTFTLFKMNKNLLADKRKLFDKNKITILTNSFHTPSQFEKKFSQAHRNSLIKIFG